MRINTNILSLSAQRNLATTTRALARAMEKLASGSRINSARDDAAGLAISTGLEAQRRGVLQSIRNMNEAQGYLNTADSIFSEQANIIQRMRELALQSANGTLAENDRVYLNSEFEQILSELQRLSDQTSYNDEPLFNGTALQKKIQVGNRKGEFISLSINSFELPSSLSSSITAGSRSYSAPTSYSMGNPINGNHLADLDADGDLDLMTAYGSTGAVSIRLGNGNGTFASVSTLGSTATSVITADVNNDGRIDIISTEGTTSSVAVFLGNGNGTFQSGTTFLTGGAPQHASAADLNEDGKADLMVATDSGTIAILLGNGNGTFASATTLATTSSNSRGIDTADLNNDGNYDIVVASAGGDASVFLGNGNGTFQSVKTATIGAQSQWVDAEDFNNDGILDLSVVEPNDNSVAVLIGNGDGTFKARTTMIAGQTPRRLRAADLDNDGNSDIVVAGDQAAYLAIYYGNGDGTFSSLQTLSTGAGTRPWDVSLGDVNEDGILDITSINLLGGLALVYTQGTQTVQLTESVDLDILTQENAEDILELLDEALQTIALNRSQIGAIQSRLTYAQSSSTIMLENLSSARSELSDTDYAIELAEFARLQFLQQSGLAVLTQANSSASVALQILSAI